MFKIKRPAIIGLLVVLLVFTGYLNHELTQKSQRKASKDYKNYEVVNMEDLAKDEKELVVVDNKDVVDKAEKDVSDKVKKDVAKKAKKDAADKAKKDVADKAKKDVVDSSKSATTKDDALETMAMEASMSSKSYFVEYRLSRDKLRASVVDRLDQIVSNEKTVVDTRTDAQKEIMKLGNISEKELQIEGLVKGKGYEDALVFLTDKDIKIVVSSPEFGEQDMVKILDIVKSETEYSMENIKIMKKQ